MDVTSVGTEMSMIIQQHEQFDMSHEEYYRPMGKCTLATAFKEKPWTKTRRARMRDSHTQRKSQHKIPKHQISKSTSFSPLT